MEPSSIQTAAISFQKSHLFWAPEMMDQMCDLHEEWVVKLIEDTYSQYKKFVANATKEDFDKLLTEVFTAEVWVANRRAFFTVLHRYARSFEAAGEPVSKDFAAFYRERYNPPYAFAVELR